MPTGLTRRLHVVSQNSWRPRIEYALRESSADTVVSNTKEICAGRAARRVVLLPADHAISTGLPLTSQATATGGYGNSPRSINSISPTRACTCSALSTGQRAEVRARDLASAVCRLVPMPFVPPAHRLYLRCSKECARASALRERQDKENRIALFLTASWCRAAPSRTPARNPTFKHSLLLQHQRNNYPQHSSRGNISNRHNNRKALRRMHRLLQFQSHARSHSEQSKLLRPNQPRVSRFPCSTDCAYTPDYKRQRAPRLACP